MGNLEKFLEYISEVFEIDQSEISDELTPDDIEVWDSISHMDLMAKFEEEWEVTFDVEELTEMETIGLIKKALIRHGVKL
ncbi:MAG: acyl carrier protein [Candidatus Helarchaeota archaeon]|nr:acyl carrier protein [Candidatus Helarchaeota archaeon]